ncbi:MAG: FHA domain-containing protein [Gemmataceae bacterium]
MRKECEASLKPGQAALIVTYGTTTRQHRPLKGDLVVLGRAATCDITVISPEVAPVHCILQRTPDGWRLRDCSGGRHATRLNGRSVHEEILRDTDMLQIGSFSFEVRLPAARVTPVLGSTPVVDDRVASRLKHLQRSRRNLIRLALRLRRRDRKANPLPPTLAELERQAQCLRDLQRDYEARAKAYEARLDELETVERELCDERAAFEHECTERRAQLDEAEHDLAHRQAEPVATASQEWAKVLDRRSHELNCFARYLRRCQQQLLEQMPQQREEGRTASDRSPHASGIRERLAHLHSLKQEIAGTSASAPGDQLRAGMELVTDHSERLVVAHTAEAGS